MQALDLRELAARAANGNGGSVTPTATLTLTPELANGFADLLGIAAAGAAGEPLCAPEDGT